jgi:hypothetical protein
MKCGEKNIGTLDRIVRIVLALILFAAYGMGYVRGILGYIVLIIGLILILTGVFGSCLIYSLLGMSTAKKTVQTAPPDKPA